MTPGNLYMGFAKKWSFFLKLFQRRSIGEGEDEPRITRMARMGKGGSPEG